jgi:transmembrane sensor
MTSRTHSGDVLRSDAVKRALGDPDRSPLATVLESELEEASVPELWHRIDARLALPRSTRTRKALGVALVAAAALVLFLLGGRWLGRADIAGALTLDDGGTPTVLAAVENRAAFAFTDGSRVEVAPYTELHVVQNDARTFVTALERGRSTFDVRPGGPRHWVIEAGTASVEVVGTRFEVRREEASVRVDVERGVVLVRSATLASGSVRLTAGQSVVVAGPAPPKSAVSAPAGASAAPALEASASATPSAEGSAAPTPAVESAPSPTRLETPPTPEARAVPPASRPESDAPADAVDRALLAADAARRAGDRLEAERQLEAALAAASSADKRRGLAALSLARLILTTDPKRAASVLRASFGAIPAGLVEDALARRVEAEGRAGNFAEARRLATEYRQRFPDGQRSREVTRWSGD